MDISKREMLAVMAAGAAITLPARAKETHADSAAEDVPFAVWAAINAATQGYADCIDRFDIAGLVAWFTPDCVYDYSPALQMKGREQVADGARKSLAGVEKSSHFVGPPVVRRGPEPGTFVSVVYFTATHLQKDGGGHTVYGRYLDTFRSESRADGPPRLLIAHRQTIGHLAEGTSSPRYWLDRQPS